MIRWMIVLAMTLTGPATAGEKTMGYVLRGPTEANQYIVFYDERYLSCVTRERCESLTERVPFYAAMGFERATELIDYMGYDQVLRECMLRECTEH